jgi:hypothetical protein
VRTITYVLAFGLVLCGSAAAHAQTSGPNSTRELNLSFDQDGRVTLAAKNVAMREILAEWARQCGCYVVNGDKLTGPAVPFPLLYEHETQARVLESLLRQAAGYVLTPQRAGVTSRSNFETIYILAASSPVATSYTPPANTGIYSVPTSGTPDDELPPVVPIPSVIPRAAPSAEPNRAPGSSTPMSAAPASRTPGMVTTFVPIVPIGAQPNNSPAPGSVSPTGPPAPLPVPVR